jgi:hypothetical protein
MSRCSKQNTRPVGCSRCRMWVKNGPDALEMGCLYYPRKQTSVSYAADQDVIVCYGSSLRSTPAATVHFVDDEIIGWLQGREQCGSRSPRGSPSGLAPPA